MLVLEGNFEIFHSGEDLIVIINGGKIMKHYNGSIIFCEEKLTWVMKYSSYSTLLHRLVLKNENYEMMSACFLSLNSCVYVYLYVLDSN